MREPRPRPRPRDFLDPDTAVAAPTRCSDARTSSCRSPQALTCCHSRAGLTSWMRFLVSPHPEQIADARVGSTCTTARALQNVGGEQLTAEEINRTREDARRRVPRLLSEGAEPLPGSG